MKTNGAGRADLSVADSENCRIGLPPRTVEHRPSTRARDSRKGEPQTEQWMASAPVDACRQRHDKVCVYRKDEDSDDASVAKH